MDNERPTVKWRREKADAALALDERTARDSDMLCDAAVAISEISYACALAHSRGKVLSVSAIGEHSSGKKSVVAGLSSRRKKSIKTLEKIESNFLRSESKRLW